MAKIVEFAITGVGAILMHNPEGMRATQAIERGGKKIPTPEEEATAGLYALPDGQLYIKTDAFREAGLISAASIRDPASRGRRSMTARFSASVFLTQEHCRLYRATNNKRPITKERKEWEIDTRRAVVQRNGILRSRPKITDWWCILPFEYDEQVIDPLLIDAIMNGAGKYPGILDYRVGKKGMFGRFTVQLLNGKKK
jgi:hypothetical protein